ncbi:hypothetical protein PRVXH_001622 [Proteinivorax hydrogeniformans]|uniref:CT398-like coiled coil hairpin domain-containing protein n=1 Tax=Proteinivorax hydrogeniformans TaxID=1826727 RepID=A0AAU8HPY1_9FIRM
MIEKLKKLQDKEINQDFIKTQILDLKTKKETISFIDASPQRLEILKGILKKHDQKLSQLDDKNVNSVEKLKVVEQKYEENIQVKELEVAYQKANSLKEQISKLENEQISVMEEKEGVEKEIEQQEDEIKSQKRIYEEQLKGLNTNLTELNVTGKKEKKEIEVLRQEIPVDILARYEKLKHKLKLPVIINIKDGYCTACGMEQPSYTGKQKLKTCVNCSRIFNV